nr:cold-shock protein [uncultured Actinoplanes sp.]
MQGTIATYDPDTRSGTLLLDDGTALTYGAAAFDASGLRRLRSGQRVDVDIEPGGAVRTVRIPGIS